MYMKNINGWWVNIDSIFYIRPDKDDPKHKTTIISTQDNLITVPWPMKKVLAAAGIADRDSENINFDEDDNDIK